MGRSKNKKTSIVYGKLKRWVIAFLEAYTASGQLATRVKTWPDRRTNWVRFSLHKKFALALVSYLYAKRKLIPFCIPIRRKIKIIKKRFNRTRCFHICVEGFPAVKPLFVNLEFAYSRKVTKEGSPKRIAETRQYKNTARPSSQYTATNSWKKLFT